VNVNVMAQRLNAGRRRGIDRQRSAGLGSGMITEQDAPLSKTTNSDNPSILTKANLIEDVSRVLEIPRKDAAVIVERIFDSMVHALDRGDKVEIRGFGSFRTRQRRERVARNPKTGARVEVPAKRIVFFKPSKELRELVEKI
jgi:integration host factor subunit beta